MDQNVGASFGLSVLIVIFFAVVLYQPDSPPSPVASLSPPPPVEVVEAKPPESPKPRHAESPVGPPRTVAPSARRIVPDPPSKTFPAPVRRPETPRAGPREAFTVVRDGESLVDVARRVYDDDDGPDRLWMANRDMLDRADSRLTPGTVLRTP